MRVFDHFPKEATCPICRTSDGGQTVLVPIAGTLDDGNWEAVPMHLMCAVAQLWDEGLQMGIISPKAEA